MLEVAEDDGIYLCFEDCYRSYWRQDAAYNRRCPITTVPVFSDGASGGRVEIGTKEARVCTGPPTARAGESNHGWGRAVDFKEPRNTLTCYDKEFLWLQTNAHRFGWVHPEWAQCGQKTTEAWHWEFAGVTDPTLVDYVRIDPYLIATTE